MFTKIIQSEEAYFEPRFLHELLGDFDIPRFPSGTSFALYEGKIPLAQVPLPNGGSLFLAFDKLIPRKFPCGSFIKHGDFIIQEEFYAKLIHLNRR